jgi:catechol 2,3-dioxygenase-like lactoylglutathione lyase family enzyme
MILELNHISLFVKDITVSRYFYGEVLELPALVRPPFDFDGAWFALGNQQLHLIGGRNETENIPLAGSRQNHYALKVFSIRAVEDFLKNKQIPYRGPKVNAGGLWQIFIFDPDGYCIELHSDENS